MLVTPIALPGSALDLASFAYYPTKLVEKQDTFV
jgi:hypothetical protein